MTAEATHAPAEVPNDGALATGIPDRVSLAPPRPHSRCRRRRHRRRPSTTCGRSTMLGTPSRSTLPSALCSCRATVVRSVLSATGSYCRLTMEVNRRMNVPIPRRRSTTEVALLERISRCDARFSWLTGRGGVGDPWALSEASMTPSSNQAYRPCMTRLATWRSSWSVLCHRRSDSSSTRSRPDGRTPASSGAPPSPGRRP